jgi:hypothetical protein
VLRLQAAAMAGPEVPSIRPVTKALAALHRDVEHSMPTNLAISRFAEARQVNRSEFDPESRPGCVFMKSLPVDDFLDQIDPFNF